MSLSRLNNISNYLKGNPQFFGSKSVGLEEKSSISPIKKRLYPVWMKMNSGQNSLRYFRETLLKKDQVSKNPVRIQAY